MLTEISLNGRSCCQKRRDALNAKPEPPRDTRPKKPAIHTKKADIFSAGSPDDGSEFRKYYCRGDLPLVIDFSGANRSLRLTADSRQLDLKTYLPLFIEGMRDTEDPYNFIASEGLRLLIETNSDRVIDIIPHVIMPLKRILESSLREVVLRGVKTLQTLLLCDVRCAEELVPFVRNLLAPLSKHLTRNVNIGDRIEYSQQKAINLPDIIMDTVTLLETHGGPQAYANIKYMIPTYESCVRQI